MEGTSTKAVTPAVTLLQVNHIQVTTEKNRNEDNYLPLEKREISASDLSMA